MPEVRPEPDPHPLSSLSTQVILFVFFSTLFTSLVLSWIAIETTERHLRNEIDSSFPAHLSESGSEISSWLGTRQRELGLPLANLALAGGGDLAEELQHLEHFDALARYDSTGRRFETAGPAAAMLPSSLSLDALPLAPNFVTLSGTAGRPSLCAVLPIESSLPEEAAWIVGALSRTALDTALRRAGDSVPGRLLLADQQGAIVAGEIDSPGPGVTSSGIATAPAPIIAGQLDVVETTNDAGLHVLVIGRKILGTSVLLVLEAPFDDVFAPVLSLVKRIFAADLAIIMLLSLVAFRAVTRIMQPIEVLSEGARVISEGNLDHEIPVPRTLDEIGLLTRTFNEMIHKLRAHQKEIQVANEALRGRNEELQGLNETLAQLSITDGLTKLHNHRYFQDQLTREISLNGRTHAPLSLLLVDLDNFKQLNDQYGHAIGDEILVNVAMLMNGSVRATDLLARYGGEEFVVLAPNTELSGAIRVAEKIRFAIDQDDFDIANNPAGPIQNVSVSIGVAQFQGDRREVFDAADRALYRAKAGGKNCVIAADETAGDPARD